MKHDIKVPSMGESISEAVIGQILASEDALVKADAEIVELETDKVNQVLYAPQPGRIKWKVKFGDTVRIGQTIGVIESEEAVRSEEAAPVEVLPAEEAAPPCEQPITGETRHPLSVIRKVIAQRLVESQRTAAVLTTFNEVDLSHVVQLREKYQESFTKKYGVRLGFMSFFIKAAVSALRAFPVLNAYLDGDDMVYRHYFHMGVAVGTDKGVIVPVIRDCDRCSCAELEGALAAYAKKAREGTLSADDLQGGGFTITNGGIYGSLLSTPILLPPQCGILGMHKIEKRPVVIQDQVEIRPMMYVALSYDHRLVDGKEAISFLVHVKNMLEDPARLLLDI